MSIYDQTVDQLEKTAVYVSELRRGLRLKACDELRKEDASHGNLEAKMTKMGKKVAKGHHRTPNKLLSLLGENCIEETPPGLRHKKKRAKPLSPMDKMQISYKILV